MTTTLWSYCMRHQLRDSKAKSSLNWWQPFQTFSGYKLCLRMRGPTRTLAHNSNWNLWFKQQPVYILELMKRVNSICHVELNVLKASFNFLRTRLWKTIFGGGAQDMFWNWWKGVNSICHVELNFTFILRHTLKHTLRLSLFLSSLGLPFDQFPLQLILCF
jgi:hypothetical protein